MRLYIDLDGVLTDFDSQVSKLLDKEFGPGDELSDQDWKKITKEGEKFWSKMDWKYDAKNLWKKLKKYDPVILTAPTQSESSIEGKKEWLKDNLPGVPFIIETDKEKYANPDAVLIDDRKSNIEKWEAEDGIGILYENDVESTINKLKEKVGKIKAKEAYKVASFLVDLSRSVNKLGYRDISKKIDKISNAFRSHPVVIDPYDDIVQKSVLELGPTLKEVDVIKLEPTCPSGRLAWVTNEDFFKGKPGKQRVIHLCLKKIKDSFQKTHGQKYTITDPSEKQKMKETVKKFLKDVVLPHETEHIKQEMKYKGEFGPGSEWKAEQAEKWKNLEDMGFRKKAASAIKVLDYMADELESRGFLKEAYGIDVINDTIEKMLFI